MDKAEPKTPRKVVADLKIQSMLFDMDIDWETLTLVPKSTYVEPAWLARWKDRTADADFNIDMDIDKE